jgi:hypothetical protein
MSILPVGYFPDLVVMCFPLLDLNKFYFFLDISVRFGVWIFHLMDLIAYLVVKIDPYEYGTVLTKWFSLRKRGSLAFITINNAFEGINLFVWISPCDL